MFANAGLGKVNPMAFVTEAEFDQTFDVNVKGTFFTVQKLLPLIPDGGSIIQCLYRRQQRDGSIQRLLRNESRPAVLCADLDDRSQSAQDPSQHP